MGRKIHLGVIGLGQRGSELVKYVYSEHPDVEFIALCDVYEDRREETAKALEEMGRVRPMTFSDYKEMLQMEELDAVLICASWETHSAIAMDAMRAGKAVASEVGGAYSISECWKLVDCYEETKTPIMFMENCVYGRDEMMVYHMAEAGVLGEIVHCEGGYRHDLREEVSFGREKRHYRLDNYIHRNTENYPTHELGPIARILHLNRGNRMLALTSMASKAAGLHAYIQEKKPELLIHSAGVAYYGFHESLNQEKISEMMKVNLEAPLFLSQFFLRDIKEKRGHIFFISSVTALHENSYGAVYGATKAGLLSFARSLFAENRKSGLKVHSILPDMTDTDLYRNADFTIGENRASYLLPSDVASAVETILRQREGVVLGEVHLRPQLFQVTRKPADKR